MAANDRNLVGELRWSPVHGEGLDVDQVARLAKLGAGVLAPAMLRFEGEDLTAEWAVERAGFVPPLRSLLAAGVPVDAGSGGR